MIRGVVPNIPCLRPDPYFVATRDQQGMTVDLYPGLVLTYYPQLQIVHAKWPTNADGIYDPTGKTSNRVFLPISNLVDMM